DPQAIGDEAPGCRTASRPHRDPLLARVADEIPGDQEVPGGLPPLDHLDFIRETPLVLVDVLLQNSGRGQLLQPGQPLREAVSYDVLAIFVESKPGRPVEVR